MNFLGLRALGEGKWGSMKLRGGGLEGDAPEEPLLMGYDKADCPSVDAVPPSRRSQASRFSRVISDGQPDRFWMATRSPCLAQNLVDLSHPSKGARVFK